MNKIKTISKPALLLLACLLAVGARAQGTEAKIGREEIVANAWKAMFGARSAADIRSLYVEGYFHGKEVPNRMTIKRPNLFHNETPSGILVFDGRRAAWVKREPDEKGNPRGPELIQPEYWRHFEVDIALVFPAFFDYPAEFKGVEKLDGADAYVLRVRLPLGGIVTYFVDARSFLVTRRLVSWNGEADPELWENLIEGYVDLGGITFPEGYTYQGRAGREKGIFKNVRFNIDPDAGLFMIPKELQ